MAIPPLLPDGQDLLAIGGGELQVAFVLLALADHGADCLCAALPDELPAVHAQQAVQLVRAIQALSDDLPLLTVALGRDLEFAPHAREALPAAREPAGNQRRVGGVVRRVQLENRWVGAPHVRPVHLVRHQCRSAVHLGRRVEDPHQQFLVFWENHAECVALLDPEGAAGRRCR